MNRFRSFRIRLQREPRKCFFPQAGWMLAPTLIPATDSCGKSGRLTAYRPGGGSAMTKAALSRRRAGKWHAWGKAVIDHLVWLVLRQKTGTMRFAVTATDPSVEEQIRAVETARSSTSEPVDAPAHLSWWRREASAHRACCACRGRRLLRFGFSVRDRPSDLLCRGPARQRDNPD